MKYLRDLKSGDLFWSCTDTDIIQYKVIGSSSKDYSISTKFITAREVEKGIEVQMSEDIIVFSNKQEALESFIDAIIEKKEDCLLKKEKLESELNTLNSMLDEHITTMVRQINYPKVGDSFYWKGFDGKIHKDVCYEIEEYDREGFYDPRYRILKDSWGRGSRVSKDMIVGVI